MKMSSEEVLVLVFEWLAKHAPDALEKLHDDVPAAKTILAGESKSAKAGWVDFLSVK